MVITALKKEGNEIDSILGRTKWGKKSAKSKERELQANAKIKGRKKGMSLMSPEQTRACPLWWFRQNGRSSDEETRPACLRPSETSKESGVYSEYNSEKLESFQGDSARIRQDFLNAVACYEESGGRGRVAALQAKVSGAVEQDVSHRDSEKYSDRRYLRHFFSCLILFLWDVRISNILFLI